MSVPVVLQSAATWWAVYYADHQFASLTVRYFHLAALLVGGGTALAIDRQVLASAGRGNASGRETALASLRGSHTVVVPALAVVAVSGALMAAADWTTFVESDVFWFKMAAVGLLLANGAGLVLAERTFARRGETAAWRRLVAASGASFVLWLLILWLGAWLTVAA